jgi:hypothetical protein
MSKAELENALRLEILEVCRAALAEHFDLDPVKQIENVSVGEITLPLCDAEGNEKYPLLKVSIPRGTRDGNGGYEPYDGHAAAVAYQEELEEKAAKKAASAAKKAAAEKERERKREAKKVVKDLNEKGLKGMIESAE